MEFLAAVSLNSAQFNLGRIVGPALAGATVAAFGYAAAFTANAVSFLAIVVALAFVRLAPLARSAGLFSRAAVGLYRGRREPSCWAAIVTIAVVAFFASPFIALVPVMARHLTHGGPRAVAQGTALLTTAQGTGAVAGVLCLAPLAAYLGRGRVLGWSLALLPPALVAYSASRAPWQGAVTLFVVGLITSASCPGCPRSSSFGRRTVPGPDPQLLPGGPGRRLPGRLTRPGAGHRADRDRPDHRGDGIAAVADHGGYRTAKTGLRPVDHRRGEAPPAAPPAVRADPAGRAACGECDEPSARR